MTKWSHHDTWRLFDDTRYASRYTAPQLFGLAEPVPAVVSDVAFCCSSSAVRFCFSAHHNYREWLFERAFLSAQTSLSILLCPVSSTRHFHPHDCGSLGGFVWLLFFFSTILTNPQLLEILKAPLLAPTSMPHLSPPFWRQARQFWVIALKLQLAESIFFWFGLLELNVSKQFKLGQTLSKPFLTSSSSKTRLS